MQKELITLKKKEAVMKDNPLKYNQNNIMTIKAGH